MRLVCNMDDCDTPPTGVIIDNAFEVIAHCDDHAPEIMHELLSDGFTRDDLITCTIDTPVTFGPRTLADNIGKRVEIAAHLDDWMRGDRYGTIVGTHGVTYTVQMDKSGTLKVYTESEVRLLAHHMTAVK